MKKKKSSVGNTIMFIINIVLAILMLLSIFAGYFKPDSHRYIAFLGLGFPYLFLVNLLFLLYFILRRSRLWLFPFIITLIGIPSVMRIVTYHKATEPAADELKFVSYNVKNLSNSNIFFNNDSIADRIYDKLNQEDADVVMLQEFYATQEDKDQIFNALKKITDTKYYIYTNYYSGRNICMVILSKHKLMNVKSIRDNKKSYALYCDMIYNDDTLRLINTHLQSLYIDLSNYQSVNSKDIINSLNIFEKLAKAFDARQYQTDLLVELIKTTPYKTILCGDFNDTPNSYTYHQIHKYLKDSFMETGNGFGFTFKELPLLRIDYMFHSSDIKATYFTVKREKGMSDHDYIVGKFRLK